MKLKKDSYWNWRHKIEEMQHAETRLTVSRLNYAIMEKDIEAAKLRTQIFTQTIKAYENSCADRKKEYEDIKLKLEKEIGHSLNDCTISDVTYEVTQHKK